MIRLIPVKHGANSRSVVRDSILSVPGEVSPSHLKSFGWSAWGWSVLILTSVLSAGCPAPREPFSFYYNPLTGNEVPLILDIDKIAIATNSGDQDELLLNIIPGEPLLDLLLSGGFGGSHFTIRLAADATEAEVLALIQRLDAREDVQWANPYVFRGFLDGNLIRQPGAPQYQEAVLDMVMVVFSTSTPESNIEDVIAEYSLEPVFNIEVFFGRETHTMRLTKQTPLPTLDTANALHEDPRTIAAYPELRTDVVY